MQGNPNDPNSLNEPNTKHGKIMMEPMMHNMKELNAAVTIIFIVGGLICGILGLTGIDGAFMFLLVSVVNGLALLIKMKFQQMKYSDMSLLSIFTIGFQNHALSFVLFWTLAYALVHIY